MSASSEAASFAVRDLSFTIAPGEVLGLVGESGSGKSVTSLALMRLLPPQARLTGEMLFTNGDGASHACSISPMMLCATCAVPALR